MIQVNISISRKLIRRFALLVLFCNAMFVAATAIGSEYSDLVTSYGPVAYWRLGESSGTTAVETTGAHNGTYQNAMTLAQTGGILGDSNTAVSVGNGANDRVQVPAFGISGGITILAWYKPNGFGNDRFLAKATGTAVTDHYWALGIDSGTRLSSFLKISGTTQNRTPTVSGLETGVWCFVALTYDGSSMTTYMNGVLVDNAAFAGTLTTDSAVAVALGNLPSGAGNRACNGVLDEVALYNVALTATQISNLYLAAGGGLLAHWKLVETSGTTATDSSLQVNHGTYTNGVVLAAAGPYPGGGNKAGDFDGVNDYVAIANEAYYDLTGAMSVAAWFKVDAFDQTDQALVTKGTGAWRLQRSGTTNFLMFAANGLTTTSVVSTANVNDGKWHHVVGVYTGSQLQIYIDGVLNNSVASTGSINTNNQAVAIGRNNQGSALNFNGAIHDVRIYNRNLSATDVTRLYGFVGHWKLDQTSGTAATDSSPAASHGTVNGTVNWATDCAGTNVFDFNGSTNYMSIANASHLQPTSALSIAAWIKGDSWGAGSSCDAILRKGDANPNNYQLDISDGRVELLLDGSEPTGHRGNTVLATGRWYHVAAVWDGATVRIFVDGVLDNTPPARTGTIGIDTRALLIGGRSGADQFDGMIRDVRFWNRAISDADVRKLAGNSGRWMFSEGTGTTAADSSGNANNATLSGGATWTTTCSGENALLTNGAGGIAQTNSPFTPPDTGTVVFWMRSSGVPTGTAHICGLVGDWEIRQVSSGTLAFDLNGEAGTDFVSTSALTEVNRWYHVAATFDSSNDTYAVYIDGQLQKSGTNTNAMVQQAAANLSFGMRTGYATEYWAGAIRDFRVYSRKLCATEIAALYGLLGHWKFDETSGLTAADSSGLGNHATYSGSPTLGVAAQNDLGTHFPSNGTMAIAPASASLNSLGASNANFCVAFWVKPIAATGDWRPLLHKGSVNFERGPGLWLNPGNTRIHFRVSTTASNNEGTDTIANVAVGAWSHVACVKAGNKWRCYVNGVLDTEFTLSGTTTGNSGPLYLGDDPWYAGSNVHMDDVRVYNRGLCPSEVQTLYNSGVSFAGVKIIKWVELQ